MSARQYLTEDMPPLRTASSASAPTAHRKLLTEQMPEQAACPKCRTLMEERDESLICLHCGYRNR